MYRRQVVRSKPPRFRRAFKNFEIGAVRYSRMQSRWGPIREGKTFRWLEPTGVYFFLRRSA